MDSADTVGNTLATSVATAGRVRQGEEHDDAQENDHDVDAKDIIVGNVSGSTSAQRKSSFIDTVASVAKQQVHFSLQEEDDGPPVRSVSAIDGKSFYTPRASLPKREQVRLLFEGAKEDIKERRLFSPYDADRVLNYFDGVISFVAVFLYEELGWARTINVRGDPTPLLLSLLCYYHIVVYWLNTHHFLKFSPRSVMSLPQVWCIMAYSLGLVLYPLSLGSWIEKGENETYYYINTGVCFFLTIFNYLTKIDDSANSLFVLWHRAGPAMATVVYGVATILKTVVKWDGSDYLLYITPFFFMIPLGAQRDTEDEDLANSNIFRRALRDLRRGNAFSPYPMGRALDFFDAVVGLACVFIFLDLGWEAFEDSNGLLAGILCYTHVMAYWLNVHHALKFSPTKMSVLQVWCVIFFSLGMIFYPLAISAWVEEGSVEIYYFVNLALCGFMVIFSFLTKIEPGRSKVLYRWWHKVAPMIALLWYIIAYTLYRTGNGQLWMLIVAPIVALVPLGGEKEEPPVATKCSPKGSDRFEVNSNHGKFGGREVEDDFFDCLDRSSKSMDQSNESSIRFRPILG